MKTKQQILNEVAKGVLALKCHAQLIAPELHYAAKCGWYGAVGDVLHLLRLMGEENEKK